MLCDVSLGVLVWLFVHRFSVNNVNNEIVYNSFCQFSKQGPGFLLIIDVYVHW